jgi:hypothetical protein
MFLTALGTGKLVYDMVTKHYHLATSTLLILFAAFQIFGIGLLADLVVRVTKSREEIDPISLLTDASTGE